MVLSEGEVRTVEESDGRYELAASLTCANEAGEEVLRGGVGGVVGE